MTFDAAQIHLESFRKKAIEKLGVLKFRVEKFAAHKNSTPEQIEIREQELQTIFDFVNLVQEFNKLAGLEVSEAFNRGFNLGAQQRERKNFPSRDEREAYRISTIVELQKDLPDLFSPSVDHHAQYMRSLAKHYQVRSTQLRLF